MLTCRRQSCIGRHGKHLHVTESLHQVSRGLPRFCAWHAHARTSAWACACRHAALQGRADLIAAALGTSHHHRGVGSKSSKKASSSAGAGEAATTISNKSSARNSRDKAESSYAGGDPPAANVAGLYTSQGASSSKSIGPLATERSQDSATGLLVALNQKGVSWTSARKPTPSLAHSHAHPRTALEPHTEAPPPEDHT